MNYEAINRFTREKEMGKEKRTFGTLGSYLGKKKWGVAWESNSGHEA